MTGARDTAFGGDNSDNESIDIDNDNDNDNESIDNDSDEGDIMGSRRLDSVFWWPPSGPDGSRWAHLQNPSSAVGDPEGGAAYDEHGNPVTIDQGRLRLKTKRFSPQQNQQQQQNQRQQQVQQLLHRQQEGLSTNGIPTTRKRSDGDGDGDGNGDRANPIGDDPSTNDLGLEEEDGDVVNRNRNGIVDPEKNKIGNGLDIDKNIETFDVPDNNTCSICLCELEEGDWVGDIPCDHLFHKDCLKEWLVKNNHCPICRMTGIASHPVVVVNVHNEQQQGEAAES